MDYDELLKIAAGENTGNGNKDIIKLLSPSALEKPEDLEGIISARFRYTGPGKWVKILREQHSNRISNEK